MTCDHDLLREECVRCAPIDYPMWVHGPTWLDRLTDWVDAHDALLTRIAVLFLLLALLYVAAHVGVAAI